MLLIGRLYIIHSPIVILYIPPYPYNLLVLPGFTTQGVMLLQRDDVFRFFAPTIASIANCQSSMGKYLSCCLYSFVTSSIIIFLLLDIDIHYCTSIIIYRQKYPHFHILLTITLHLSSSIVRNLPISIYFHIPHLEKWPPYQASGGLKLLDVCNIPRSSTSPTSDRQRRSYGGAATRGRESMGAQ